MAVRSSMANLIARVRVLTNDTLPAGSGQVFSDQTIQDVMDETRVEMRNVALGPSPTFSGSDIQYLDYYSDLGSWEEDYVLKQFLTVVVTPSVYEPISGHFVFAQTTLPPVYITGKLYDVYRSAADLLERRAAVWMMNHSLTVDGQSLARGQVFTMMMQLAKSYRMKQRAVTIGTIRTDIAATGDGMGMDLGPREIDFIGSGNANGT